MPAEDVNAFRRVSEQAVVTNAVCITKMSTEKIIRKDKVRKKIVVAFLIGTENEKKKSGENGRSIKLLLDLASTVILGFESPMDPWPYSPFQDFYVFGNGASLTKGGI